MNDVGPGDFVECVDVAPPPFPTRLNVHPSSLSLHSVYTVRALCVSRLGRPMLILNEVQSAYNPQRAYYAYRFRPIYRPKSEIIESLKAPAPELEPA